MTSTVVSPLARAVAQVRQLDDVEVAFAARLDRRSRSFVLGELLGARATSLHGLVIPTGCGVGGRCMALRKPIAVSDYARSPDITHQFDHAVSQEGLRAVMAVPFRLGGEVRGVVYGASRRPVRFGERMQVAAATIVRRAEQGLATAAVADRLAEAAQRLDPAATAIGGRAVAEMRELHAELRAIAAVVTERSVQDRLHDICLRLGGDAAPKAAGRSVRLSPREIDVLAQVAVGCSNAEVAQRLSLRVATVKAYLKTAMSKLDSHNRTEAVVTARRAGLLP